MAGTLGPVRISDVVLGFCQVESGERVGLDRPLPDLVYHEHSQNFWPV